ncbi:MAG: hypothetical protein ABEK84_07640 [Salinibacter sp.]
MSRLRLSTDWYRRRIEAVTSARRSSITIEPMERPSTSPIAQANLRFRSHMHRRGVTLRGLLDNLQRVKKDLADQRQNR